nr:hypothetical protein [uncultured Flavobacterium sp.]
MSVANKDLVSFSRFYNEKGILMDVSMNEMNAFIQDEQKKELIAEYVYERLYTRFLKIFDFQHQLEKEYTKNSTIQKRNVFNEEYKNGFLMMSSCALLIETFAAFLEGHNETPRGNINSYTKVFEKAEEWDNDLKLFKNSHIYKHIRCGLLHQAETTGKYKITRRKDVGILEDKTINAQKFFDALKELLQKYKEHLATADWNCTEWHACRSKIGHIVNNSL